MKKDLKIREEREKLKGTKIKSFTLIDLYYVQAGATRQMPKWKCECDCGKIEFFFHYSLLKNKIKDCSFCKPDLRRGKSNCNWSGYEDLPGTLLSSFQRGAKSRLLEFSVTPKYLWDLYLSQNKKCALSGIDLIFCKSSKSRDGNISLDRIDNSKGYIEGNVRWVTKDINLMRRLLDDNDFIEYCRCVVDFNINKKDVNSYLSTRAENKLKITDNPNHLELKRIKEYEKFISEKDIEIDGYKNHYIPVIRINPITREETEYESITFAGKENGVTKDAICKVLSGKNKTSAGFLWKKKELNLIYDI